MSGTATAPAGAIPTARALPGSRSRRPTRGLRRHRRPAEGREAPHQRRDRTGIETADPFGTRMRLIERPKRPAGLRANRAAGAADSSARRTRRSPVITRSRPAELGLVERHVGALEQRVDAVAGPPFADAEAAGQRQQCPSEREYAAPRSARRSSSAILAASAMARPSSSSANSSPPSRRRASSRSSAHARPRRSPCRRRRGRGRR